MMDVRWPANRAPSRARRGLAPRRGRAADGRSDRAGRAFAFGPGADAAELLAAPVHWPRRRACAAPLALPAGQDGRRLAALGLQTVGALLEHLPTRRREARTVAALRARRAGHGRRGGALDRRPRPVRRRGMRPLVEAIVFDASGSMRAMFFNQPWLVHALSGRHAARAARQGRGRAPLPRLAPRARRARSPTPA